MSEQNAAIAVDANSPEVQALLAKYPLHFDDLYVNLVDAGERSGALETLLIPSAENAELKSLIEK